MDGNRPSPKPGDMVTVRVSVDEQLYGKLLAASDDDNVIVLSDLKGWMPGTKIAINGEHIVFVAWVEGPT